MLYPGQLYGWSSLLYILKQEGFYADYCNENNTFPTTLYQFSNENLTRAGEMNLKYKAMELF